MNTIRYGDCPKDGAQKKWIMPQSPSWVLGSTETDVDLGFSRCKSEEFTSHSTRNRLAGNYAGSARSSMFVRTMSLATPQNAAHSDCCLQALSSDQMSVERIKQSWRNKHIASQQVLSISQKSSWFSRLMTIPKCSLRKQQ